MNAALLALSCFAWMAQVASGQAAAPATIDAGRAANGHAAITITNASGKTITAFLIAGAPDEKLRAGRRVQVTPYKIYDAATEPRVAKPLPPNGTVFITDPIFDRNGGAAPSLRAAIFVDGTAWGDSESVNRMFKRRTTMEKVLRAAILDLTLAAERRVSSFEVRDGFEAARLQEEKAAADADEIACIRSVRGVVELNLERARYSNGAPVIGAELIRVQLESLRGRLLALIDYGAHSQPPSRTQPAAHN